MSEPRENSQQHARAERRVDDDALLEALRQPVRTPDLSEQIMRRLGYQRITKRRHRRLVMLRWAGRIGATCVVAIAAKFGIEAFESGPSARIPAGPTMTEALQNDLTAPIKFERPKFRVPESFAPIQPKTQPVSTPPNEAVGPFKWV